MQLNVFTDYSFRVLIYAAVHSGRRCTAEEISIAFNISRHHIVKVVNGLQHLGYLETQRGRGGGFVLARAPKRIRLGEVVRQAEGSLAVAECFDRKTNTCPLARGCGLSGVLAEASDAFFAVLDRYTLADLVARPQWTTHVVNLIPTERRPHA
jgi:Rrf2 family nitric oxide-sensitive transcriptional repressor